MSESQRLKSLDRVVARDEHQLGPGARELRGQVALAHGARGAALSSGSSTRRTCFSAEAFGDLEEVDLARQRHAQVPLELLLVDRVEQVQVVAGAADRRPAR